MGGRKKLTTEEFIEKSRKIHGDKYDYSNVKYITDRIKVNIILVFTIFANCQLQTARRI